MSNGCSRRTALGLAGAAGSLVLGGCAARPGAPDTASDSPPSRPNGTAESPADTPASRTGTPTPSLSAECVSTAGAVDHPNTVTTEPSEQSGETVTASGTTHYAFGQWHVDGFWQFSVERFELTSTIETDDGEVFELPAETRLGFLATKVRSTARKIYLPDTFVCIVDSSVYHEQRTVELPGMSRRIQIDELQASRTRDSILPKAWWSA